MDPRIGKVIEYCECEDRINLRREADLIRALAQVSEYARHPIICESHFRYPSVKCNCGLSAKQQQLEKLLGEI